MCWSQEKRKINPRGTVQYLFGFLYMNYYSLCMNFKVKVSKKIVLEPSIPTLCLHQCGHPLWHALKKFLNILHFNLVPPFLLQRGPHVIVIPRKKTLECAPFDPDTPIHVR